jgi:hypothetical protein
VRFAGGDGGTKEGTIHVGPMACDEDAHDAFGRRSPRRRNFSDVRGKSQCSLLANVVRTADETQEARITSCIVFRPAKFSQGAPY